jgi:hypothetical protein
LLDGDAAKRTAHEFSRVRDNPVVRAFWASVCPPKKPVIRKLKSGKYRLYSRKVDPKTGRRRNLGTFGTRAAAEQHERAIQFFKRQR